MEEARDEEIEKQEIPEDSDEIEMQDIAGEKEEEKDENAVTEETPAVDAVHHSKLQQQVKWVSGVAGAGFLMWYFFCSFLYGLARGQSCDHGLASRPGEE